MDMTMADVIFLAAKKCTNSTGSMFNSHFWYIAFLKADPINLKNHIWTLS
jgi:hypothetical protein